MENLNYWRFNDWEVMLKDWSVVEVKGRDGLLFLQGQTTNDLKKLEVAQSRLNARLNHHGRVQSFFYTALSSSADLLYLFIPNVFLEPLVNDLNKFVIMDDVQFVLRPELSLFFIAQPSQTSSTLDIANSLFFKAEYAGVSGSFSFKGQQLPQVKMEDLELLMDLNGFPVMTNKESISCVVDKLINETRLNDLAISYSKGCFLGQETVAKIENNRGAAYFPVLIKLNNVIKEFSEKNIFNFHEKIGFLQKMIHLNGMTFGIALLNRENRVAGKKINFTIDESSEEQFSGEVIYFPYFKNSSPHDLAIELYHQSVALFNANKIEEAIKLIDHSIRLEMNTENVEVKGVMLGRLEKYDEAIMLMNQLEQLDPQSVMAHTNKSIYLMKLGKIEEAEEEKSKATVLSFEQFGVEAKLKKSKEEDQKRKEEELQKREKMFLKVLEIDTEDAIANFGMGDIYFQKGKYIDALNHLSQAIKSNAQYSMAYLLLGKVNEALLDTNSAKEIYEKGIAVATKRGDMMPANEMQSRLNFLS